jgi:oxygen-independent coproporphyrinogen-3 oxidase
MDRDGAGGGVGSTGWVSADSGWLGAGLEPGGDCGDSPSHQIGLERIQQINNLATARNTIDYITFMQIQNGIEDPSDLRHLYIHIPFCPRICPYCSFYKEASDRNKTQAFLDSILVELDQRLDEIPECRLETIFFGGGTPSALSVKQLEFLLAGLRQRLDLSNIREWTLEMNPATVSLEKAKMLRDFGVNRISMGVQSWNSKILETLGRAHSAEQAERSFKILREAGFSNLNLDFIFGVPGQSTFDWQETLEKTIGLEPEHISAYCLTYEEDTDFFERFSNGDLKQDVDQDATLYELTMRILEKAGYQQYEISNYARAGLECLHNLAYWLGRNYLGLGPSAFSTVGSRRWKNTPDTSRYIEQIQSKIEPIAFEETLSGEMRQAERIAFGLRTSTGVSESQMANWPDELASLLSEGYLEKAANRFRLTAKGRMVADSVAELFV